MLTPDERAIKNRANAQKSTGPNTPEGKHRSSKNSLKHGLRAEALKNFIPPHPAVACNQNRQLFFRLHEKLIKKYEPHDHAEAIIVKKVACAEWRSQTFDETFTALWNQKLLDNFDGTAQPMPEFTDCFAEIDTFLELAGTIGADRAYIRMKKEMDRAIATCDKRLILLRKHFPSRTSYIERKDFDRERREFYKAHPELLETEAEPTNEATFSDGSEAPESFQLIEQ